MVVVAYKGRVKSAIFIDGRMLSYMKFADKMEWFAGTIGINYFIDGYGVVAVGDGRFGKCRRRVNQVGYQ